MKHFGKAMRALAQSGQYHTIVESRVHLTAMSRWKDHGIDREKINYIYLKNWINKKKTFYIRIILKVFFFFFNVCSNINQKINENGKKMVEI